MSDELAFRAALAANPADATARLVYADWLDEHGRPLDAALQRVLGQPDDDGRRLEYADAVGGERGEFVRVQCRVAALSASRFPHSHDDLPEGAECPICLEFSVAQQKAAELLSGDHGRNWRHWIGPAIKVVPPGAYYYNHVDFCRGFVEEVTCTADDWLRWGDAIREQQPVARVRLTTLPGPGWYGHDYRGAWVGCPAPQIHPWPAGHTHVPAGDYGTTNYVIRHLLTSIYPGIEFELPGGFLVPHEFSAVALTAMMNAGFTFNTYS